MVVKLLIATSSCHVKLVGVPKFCEGRFDVVFVHAEYFLMELSALFADERAISDIYMG